MNSPLPPHRSWPHVRRVAKLVLTPVALVLATLYFLIDGIFVALIRGPIGWLMHRPLVARLMAKIARLGPYATLVLMLVPIILLEPLKPFALYLMAQKRVVAGTAVLVLAEVLKVVTVERLFHLSRNKLMSIPAFAWVYRFAARWLGVLEALPPWQFATRRVDDVKRWVGRLRRTLG